MLAADTLVTADICGNFVGFALLFCMLSTMFQRSVGDFVIFSKGRNCYDDGDGDGGDDDDWCG